MGRRRRDGNCTPQKNKSIEDLVGNEENGYPVPDPNKTMINIIYEHSDAHKKIPQRRNPCIIHGEDTNQKVQHALKKFQDTKNEEHE
jgi:hypothetical protein